MKLGQPAHDPAGCSSSSGSDNCHQSDGNRPDDCEAGEDELTMPRDVSSIGRTEIGLWLPDINLGAAHAG